MKKLGNLLGKKRSDTTKNDNENTLKLTPVKKSASAKEFFFSVLGAKSNISRDDYSDSDKNLKRNLSTGDEEGTNLGLVKLRDFEVESEKNEEKLEDFIKNTVGRERKLSLAVKFDTAKITKNSEISDEEILFQATLKRDLSQMKEILKTKTLNINWKNKNLGGTTSLHACAFHNFTEGAELLIDQGADLEMTDQRSRTPLHIAVYKGNIDVIAILLSKKAKVNIKDGFGNAPIHIALRQHHLDLLQPLVLAGADINFKTGSGRSIILDSILTNDLTLLKFLLLASEQSGITINLNGRDELGFTPLLKSISSGNKDALELLLANSKVDKMISTHNGQNVFHMCSIFNQPDYVKIIAKSLDESQLKILLNESDVLKNKNTPLHAAVKCNNIQVVEELLNLKDHLKLDKKNNFGKTALGLAQEMKEQEMIQAFKKKGIKK